MRHYQNRFKRSGETRNGLRLSRQAYITDYLTKTLVALILLIGGDAVNNAQTPSGDSSRRTASDVIEKGTDEFGVWGGGSFKSSTLIGTTEDARFGIIGLRYAHVLATDDSLALKYTINVIPAAVLSYPQFILLPTGAKGFIVQRTRSSVYAAGIAPIGFQLNFRRRQRVQPFAETSGGFLYFADPIPDALGKRFNFTFDFGGGAQILLSGNHAVTFGYKYHHISNGNRGVINPGFDSNLIYAGSSLFRQ